MTTTDFDHEFADAYRLGRRGIDCFTPDRAQRVLDVAAKTRAALRLTWRGARRDLIDAWLAGLRSAAARSRSSREGLVPDESLRFTGA